MRCSHAVRAVLVLALWAAAPGCTTIGGRSTDPGKVTWVLGALETRIEASVHDVHDAAEEVLGDMGLRIESSAATIVDARIVARTAQDKKLVIEVEGLQDKTCALSIKGGTFGDKELSQQVYERILKEL
jgi:Protein of unknown function (DUF3568)